MKPARLIVLGIALVAGLAAAMLAQRSPETPPPQNPVAQTPPPVTTVDVLVAAQDIGLGSTTKAKDLRWQPWPIDLVPNGAVTRSTTPTALEDFTGNIARAAVNEGELIRRERLVKAEGSGILAAMLPAGMRAFAISIDTRGATSAGGFVLPNDRVDVVRISRDEEAAKQGAANVQVSETILANIRVLAIGQQLQEKNGEKIVTGETATLEVTPTQAELLAVAQKTGQLALSLRSYADLNRQDEVREDANDRSYTVIRFGVASQSSKR